MDGISGLTGAVPVATLRGWGYEVTAVPPTAHRPGVSPLAYEVAGKRGAVYGLFRYADRPNLMYLVSGRSGTVGVAIHGNYSFCD